MLMESTIEDASNTSKNELELIYELRSQKISIAINDLN